MISKLDIDWNRSETVWRQHTVAIDTLLVEENEDLNATKQRHEAINCWTRYEVDRKTVQNAGTPHRISMESYEACRKAERDGIAPPVCPRQILHNCPPTLRHKRLARLQAERASKSASLGARTATNDGGVD